MSSGGCEPLLMARAGASAGPGTLMIQVWAKSTGRSRGTPGLRGRARCHWYTPCALMLSNGEVPSPVVHVCGVH